MGQPRKLLFIIAKLGKGGAQTIVLDLANSLVERGMTVDILLIYRTPQDQTNVERLDPRVTLVYLTKKPVSISSDFKGFGQRAIQYLKLPFLAARWAMQGRLDTYDIVHGHLLGASFLSWFLDRYCWLLDKHPPTWIETFHADLSSMGAAQKRLFYFFWKHLDVLVMELTRTDFQEATVALPNTSVCYIPFGVSRLGRASEKDVAEFMAQIDGANEKQVIVTISRLNNREKRVDKLLDALVVVKAKFGEDFICLICGDGPDGETLKNYACKLGLANQVRFIGYVDNIALPLGVARVFFVAGIEDLVGIAGLQAATLAVPVVSWQVDPHWGGPRRFFWAEHSIDHVAEELCRILSEDNYHRAAALRDQEVVLNHFSVKAMVQGYMDMYEELKPL